MNDNKKTNAQLIEELAAAKREIAGLKGKSKQNELDERIHMLLGNIPDFAIVHYDREMRYIMMDGPELGAIGFNKSNIGKTLHESHSQDIVKIFEPIYREVLNGNTFNFEIGHEGKIFSERILPARDDTGFIAGGIIIATNISDKIRKDNQIRESQERLNLALHGAELGLWDWQIRTGLLGFNNRWAEMLGYDYDELDKEYTTWENLLHTNDKAKTIKIIEEHLLNRRSKFEAEFRLQTKSGEWKWILARGKVTEWDVQGNPVRMTGTHLDITDRKIALLKLQESEEKYRLLINNTKNIIWTLDTDFNYSFISPVSEEILGYSLREQMGRSPIDICHPDDKTMFEGLINKAKDLIAKGKDIDEINSFEIRFINKKGKTVWLDIKAGIHLSDNGKFLGVIGTSADITARKQIESERETLINELKASEKIILENTSDLEKANKNLKKSESRLKEAIVTKDRFFSIIAHDLKGPFYGFLSLAKSMAENFSEFRLDEIREMSESLYGSANHLYRLLENLLEWSRTQIGSIKLEPALIVMQDFIYVNVSIFKITAAQKNIDFVIDVDAEAYANADYRMTETVLRNLISNALKFTPEGGKITIASKLRDDLVEISVADTGVGMDEEKMNDLFKIDKVESTIGTNNEEGTGLGLIICKEFVKKHENDKGAGVISVSSEHGKGTKFTFTLPKYDEEIE